MATIEKGRKLMTLVNIFAVARATLAGLGELVKNQRRVGALFLLGTLLALPLRGQQPAPAKLFTVTVGGKVGFIDRTGKVVIPPRFDNASPFNEDLALVREAGKYEFIDSSGAVVLKPPYDIVLDFSEGLAAVNIGQRRNRSLGLIMAPGRWGYIDKTGTLAIPLQFTHAEDFSEGMAGVQVGEEGGFIDHTGQLQFKVPLDVSDGFHDGVVLVQSGGEGTYFNRAGRRLPTPDLIRGSSESFSEGMAAVQIGEKWGFIDTTGTLAVPATFLAASSFSEGLAAVEVPIEMAWCRGGSDGSRYGTPKRYGYIDKSGKLVIPPLSDDPGAFSEGLASISVCSTSSFIDRNGVTVLPLPFQIISGFHDGLALIESDDGRGYIDRTGRVVWKPSR